MRPRKGVNDLDFAPFDLLTGALAGDGRFEREIGDTGEELTPRRIRLIPILWQLVIGETISRLRWHWVPCVIHVPSSALA